MIEALHVPADLDPVEGGEVARRLTPGRGSVLGAQRPAGYGADDEHRDASELDMVELGDRDAGSRGHFDGGCLPAGACLPCLDLHEHRPAIWVGRAEDGAVRVVDEHLAHDGVDQPAGGEPLHRSFGGEVSEEVSSEPGTDGIEVGAVGPLGGVRAACVTSGR